MTAVRFTARGHRYAVAFAYNPAVVQIVKDTVPGYARTWASARKEWEVDNTWAETLAATMHAAGHTVVGFDVKPPRTGASRAPDDTSRWAHLLFSRVSAERRQAVYRALSKCLHPDVGGDPVMQREMNDAFNQAKGDN